MNSASRYNHFLWEKYNNEYKNEYKFSYNLILTIQQMFHNNIKKEMNNNKTKHPPLPQKRSHTENKEVKDMYVFKWTNF